MIRLVKITRLAFDDFVFLYKRLNMIDNKHGWIIKGQGRKLCKCYWLIFLRCPCADLARIVSSSSESAPVWVSREWIEYLLRPGTGTWASLSPISSQSSGVDIPNADILFLLPLLPLAFIGLSLRSVAYSSFRLVFPECELDRNHLQTWSPASVLGGL